MIQNQHINLLRVASWMLFQDIPFVDKIIKPFQPHKELSFSRNDKIYQMDTNFEWLTGAFFMIRRKVINDVGLLDEDYFMYTEDVDYCYRVKKTGWKIGYNSKCVIIHHKGASGTSEFAVKQEYEGIKLFYKKHYPNWQYAILILLLKMGTLQRILLFALVGKVNRSKIYAKVFRQI